MPISHAPTSPFMLQLLLFLLERITACQKSQGITRLLGSWTRMAFLRRCGTSLRHFSRRSAPVRTRCRGSRPPDPCTCRKYLRAWHHVSSATFQRRASPCPSAHLGWVGASSWWWSAPHWPWRCWASRTYTEIKLGYIPVWKLSGQNRLTTLTLGCSYQPEPSGSPGCASHSLQRVQWSGGTC